MRKLHVYLFFFCYMICSGQRIVDFNLFQTGSSVLVKFSITPGVSCNGYTIFHSTDSVFFSPVSDEPAICGTSQVKEDKSFTHNSPVRDKINYYKVQLSVVETSPVKRVYVPGANLSGMIAYPNPAYSTTDSLKLRIYNTANLQLVGFLYSPSGKPQRELHLKANGEIAAFELGSLENGFYIVWLTDGYQAYSSKFLIFK